MTTLTPEVNLEDLLGDDDHLCDMERPPGRPCRQPAAHLLRGGPCNCEPAYAWVCDPHLVIALVIAWWCDSCDNPFYWREH